MNIKINIYDKNKKTQQSDREKGNLLQILQKQSWKYFNTKSLTLPEAILH